MLTNRQNNFGRAVAAFAVGLLLLVGFTVSRAAEDDLIGILSSSPLTGIGKFNDRLRMDPARFEVGTVTVNQGATTATLTYSTAAYDSSYSLFLQPSTACTTTFYYASPTTTTAVITLGAACAITNTFQYWRIDR